MKRTLIFLLAIMLSSTWAFSEDNYARVTTRSAYLRSAPSTTAAEVAVAKADDVFEIKRTEGDWYAVVISSGEYRYPRSAAVPVPTAPSLPDSESARKAAAIAVVLAQDRATSEAEQKFPRDLNNQIDLERLLNDKYVLEVLQEHRIAPARYYELAVEAATKDWLP